MAQLRILAIEDNPLHAGKLEMLLDELGYFLIEVVNNASEAIRMFRATKPDVVLMDVDLGGEKDGIDIAQQINEINPVPIIFITSFTDKTTFDRAKSTEPYAYMIKPVEKASLQASIELAVLRFAKDYFKETVEGDFFTGWSQNMLAKESFFIKTGNGLEKIRYAEVLWIHVAVDRYCDIVTGSKVFTIRASLKQLEDKLSPYQFVRTHRTHIVNIQKIDAISEQDMTVTIGEQIIPLGQAYKQVLMQKLNII